MATIRDLCINALRTSGIISPIETADDIQISTALHQFNMMLESWDLDGLFPYTTKQTQFTMTTGVESYNVGTGEVVNIDRPNRLDGVAVLNGQIYDPLRELGQLDFDNSARVLGVNGLPNIFVYRTDYPNSKIVVYPAPDSAYECVVSYQYKNSSYTLNDTFDLPSGYFGACEYGLAVILGNQYGFDTSRIFQEATLRRNAIAKLNSKPMRMHSSYSSKNGTRYDIRTDSYR